MAKLSLFERRRRRVRTAIKARAGDRPRLSIHRTGRHIYAQVIDDAQGRTVAAASTLGIDKSGANVDAAVQVGKTIAEAAKAAGVNTVVFDRGGFLFHGRVKALADAARRGALGRLTVEKADGQALIGSGGDTPIRQALSAAGFVATPKGLRLRA